MSKKEEVFRRYEKLAKAAKKKPSDIKNKPASCARCTYCGKDFKYRMCQFSRCPFDKEKDVFRKRPLKRNQFS